MACHEQLLSVLLPEGVGVYGYGAAQKSGLLQILNVLIAQSKWGLALTILGTMVNFLKATYQIINLPKNWL
jgi:hypothetical protein